MEHLTICLTGDNFNQDISQCYFWIVLRDLEGGHVFCSAQFLFKFKKVCAVQTLVFYYISGLTTYRI